MTCSDCDPDHLWDSLVICFDGNLYGPCEWDGGCGGGCEYAGQCDCACHNLKGTP